MSLACSGREFNALRSRLPRATRRGVPQAPSGYSGVIVQAVGPGDAQLATLYACVPSDEDPHIAIAALEQRLRDEFS